MKHPRLGAALLEAPDTRFVVIGAGALAQVDALFADAFGEQAAAVVVADDNTWAAAGEEVVRRLFAAGRKVESPIIFPAQPQLYASYETVLQAEGRLLAVDAIPVVAGSGTLNDITKLASHRLGRPYMVVATAASMDGYTAFGAAITKDGFKQTMQCPAPRALLADLTVLTNAPSALTSAGYGDLLGKVTAGADWILAGALEVEPVHSQAWGLVQDPLREWTDQPDRLHEGDPAAIESLLEGLVLSGIAMQLSQSSRPASGSEHRFSHLWEMQSLAHSHDTVLHGFKVGVGTLAAAALYERISSLDLANLRIDELCKLWPSRTAEESAVKSSYNHPVVAENAVQESLAKYIDAGTLRQRLTLLRERWPLLRTKLEAQLLPAAHLREMLRAAGCPTTPAEIGLTVEQLKQSYALARTIRRRYTVLDLAYEAGILDECVEELFQPDGFWGPAL